MIENYRTSATASAITESILGQTGRDSISSQCRRKTTGFSQKNWGPERML